MHPLGQLQSEQSDERGDSERTDLVQTGEDVRQVEHRLVHLVDLVEHHVPEQLQDVSVTRLGPPWIVIEPG